MKVFEKKKRLIFFFLFKLIEVTIGIYIKSGYGKSLS